MPGSKLDKALQTEVEKFANLALQISNRVTLLGDEDRLKSHLRVPSTYLTKLSSAASKYEQAVAAVLATLEPDSDQRVVYTTKLNVQSALLDPLTNRLHNAIDNFKRAEDPTPEAVTARRTARSVSSIKLRIDSSRKLIKSKINLVQDAEKEEGVLASLPKVRANLQLLEDIIVIIGKDLDEICQQILNPLKAMGRIRHLYIQTLTLCF